MGLFSKKQKAAVPQNDQTAQAEQIAKMAIPFVKMIGIDKIKSMLSFVPGLIDKALPVGADFYYILLRDSNNELFIYKVNNAGQVLETLPAKDFVLTKLEGGLDELLK